MAKEKSTKINAADCEIFSVLVLSMGEAPKTQDPTFPMMQLHRVSSLDPPCLANHTSFRLSVINLQTPRPIRDNPDDIIMTSSGVIFSDLTKLSQSYRTQAAYVTSTLTDM